MRLISAILIFATGLVLTACGSSAPEKAASSPPTNPVAGSSTTSRSAPTPKATLAKCVKKLKLTLADAPSTLKDRAAVGNAGNLPARYLGVIQYKHKPMIDVWLADNNADAVKSADALNAATAESEGVSEVEVAYNNGRAVSAMFNNLVITKLDLDVPEKIDKCLDALNDL